MGSFPKASESPQMEIPEYAFIGRSNVGKSSLINALLGRRDMAHVSGKPGKTQMLNYYHIDEQWMVCDLPGYGYAKLSKKHRTSLERMVKGYLVRRLQMQCAFVLIDSNITPQAIDLEFVNWLGSKGIPFVLIFTKADKPKKDKLEKNVEAFQQKLLEDWESLPTHFVTSSLTGAGSEEILSFINEVNEGFYQRK